MNWEKVEIIDNYIRKRKTGNPGKFAKKLKISERSIYNYLKKMKAKGAEIYFDKRIDSYCYKEEMKFVFGFKKIINDVIEVC
ncbi:MAG: HTH domain-containing protein [Bacteroidales bacterium]|nr:HTH domain-containing protein [Bacteroidales bacterium]